MYWIPLQASSHCAGVILKHSNCKLRRTTILGCVSIWSPGFSMRDFNTCSWFFSLHKDLKNSNTNQIYEILSQHITFSHHWNLYSELPVKERRRFGGRIDFASPRSSHHVGTSFLGIHPFSSALSFHKTRCLKISLITIAAFWPSTINISPSCTACCAIVVFVLFYAYRNFLAQVQLNQSALIPRAKKYMVFLLYSIVHLTPLIFATSNPRVFRMAM